MKLSTKNISALQDKLSKASNGKKTEGFAPLSGTFNGLIETVVAKTFKSGSFGYEIAYKITDEDVKGRKVWESIPVRKADGSESPFAGEKLARRLSAFGISAKEMGAFELPDTDSETGDLDQLNGAKVVLKLERELYNGKPTTRVKAVYPAKA
jgi:hypothetical protein